MEVLEVTTSENRITFTKADSPRLVGTFLHTIYNLVEKQGYKEIVIDCLEVKRAFPNVLVPIAGIVDYYNKRGIEFKFENLPSFLEKSHFYSPLVVSENHDLLQGNVLNFVWRYENDSDTYALSTEILRSISQEVLCEDPAPPTQFQEDIKCSAAEFPTFAPFPGNDFSNSWQRNRNPVRSPAQPAPPPPPKQPQAKWSKCR